jgi:hypothetical protein
MKDTSINQITEEERAINRKKLNKFLFILKDNPLVIFVKSLISATIKLSFITFAIVGFILFFNIQDITNNHLMQNIHNIYTEPSNYSIFFILVAFLTINILHENMKLYMNTDSTITNIAYEPQKIIGSELSRRFEKLGYVFKGQLIGTAQGYTYWSSKIQIPSKNDDNNNYTISIGMKVRKTGKSIFGEESSYSPMFTLLLHQYTSDDELRLIDVEKEIGKFNKENLAKTIDDGELILTKELMIELLDEIK